MKVGDRILYFVKVKTLGGDVMVAENNDAPSEGMVKELSNGGRYIKITDIILNKTQWHLIDRIVMLEELAK